MPGAVCQGIGMGGICLPSLSWGPAARLSPMTQTQACALGLLKRGWRAVAKANC